MNLKPMIGLTIPVEFIVFFVLALTGSLVYADESAVDKVSVTVPVFCAFSGTGMNAHNAEINNGIYMDNIGTTTMKAVCNDNGGFAIYVVGYTNNKIGEEDSNKLVGTAASSNATIITGVATGPVGAADTSNWAMRLAPSITSASAYPITVDSDAEGTFADYHTIPNTYTKVAHRDAGTDTGNEAEGSTFATTYATYISKTQPADTYVGQVKYTLVHPATASEPVVCNSDATTILEAECMQDFANVTTVNRDSIIASMVPERQYVLKDGRDGKKYTIAKYQVGTDQTTSEPIYDVWMTQNLDLDLDASKTYTNKDTDIGYDTVTGTYQTATWNPLRSTYPTTSTQIHEWCQGGTWDSQSELCTNSSPESYNPGDLYWDSTKISDLNDWEIYDESCDSTTSTPVCDESKNPLSTYVSSAGVSHYHLGNYYNWTAALATNDSSIYSNSDLVEQSICPAGWTLPRAKNGDSTFYSLWNKEGLANTSYIDADNNHKYDLGEKALWTSPLYFAVSGGFDGAVGYVGYVGYSWSSVARGINDAWFAYYDVNSNALSSYYSKRSDGFSVRCLARPAASSISGS